MTRQGRGTGRVTCLVVMGGARHVGQRRRHVMSVEWPSSSEGRRSCSQDPTIRSHHASPPRRGHHHMDMAPRMRLRRPTAGTTGRLGRMACSPPASSGDSSGSDDRRRKPKYLVRGLGCVSSFSYSVQLMVLCWLKHDPQKGIRRSTYHWFQLHVPVYVQLHVHVAL